MRKGWLYISLLLLFAACGKKDTVHGDENPIAKVGDMYLYISDIAALQNKTTASDSTTAIENYRSEWIKRQLLVQSASETTDHQSIYRKVEDYKTSLIISELQAHLLDNTNFEIEEEELQQYYDAYKNNFVVPATLFEVQYFILPEGTENVATLQSSLNTGAMPQEMENYCESNPTLCQGQLGKWYTKEELKENTNLVNYLLYPTPNYATHYTNESTIVLYRIKQIIEEGEAKPFETVKDKIIELATYQKKQDFLKEYTETTYQTGINNEAFEIYDF